MPLKLTLFVINNRQKVLYINLSFLSLVFRFSFHGLLQEICDSPLPKGKCPHVTHCVSYKTFQRGVQASRTPPAISPQ